MPPEERVVSPDGVDEEEAVEQSLRPKVLADFPGQGRVKENLSIAVEAAKLRDDALDHLLFYGPPGLGKTTLANIVAAEMGVSVRTTSGPAIERPGDLAAILTNLQEHDILFIDEIHRLSRSVEEILYPAMEDFAIDLVIGKGPGARSVRLAMPHFTLIGATTRYAAVSAPLRDRFGSVYRLDFYEESVLSQIVRRSASILGVDLPGPAADEIARRSRGTPRISNRILRRVRDFAAVRADGKVTLQSTQDAVELLAVIEPDAAPPAIVESQLPALVGELERTRELLADLTARIDNVESDRDTDRATIDNQAHELTELRTDHERLRTWIETPFWLRMFKPPPNKPT